MASYETIVKAVALVAKGWPDQDFNIEQAEQLYMTILGDLPDEAITAAVAQRIAGSSPFLPRVGEIRQLAIDLMSGVDDTMSAPEAWGYLLRWMRRYSGVPRWGPDGPIEPPRLPPLVHKAAQAIGGLGLISTSDNPAADRARFIEAYNTFLRRARARVATLPQVAEARRKLQAERQRLLEEGDDE